MPVVDQNSIALRVTHIASGDLWAGAESLIAQLLPALHRRHGVSVTAILLNNGELARRLSQAGIDTSVIDESLNSPLQIFWGIYKTLKALRPDVVHTHRQKENIIGSIGAHLARVPVCIRTQHGAPEFSYGKWQIHKRAICALDNWTSYRLQQQVIAVSEDLAGKIRSKCPLANISIIPNGLDALAIRSQGIPAAELDKDLIHVAFIGRMAPVKRVDVFLRAAATILRKKPNQFEFHVIGDGPLESEMRALSSDLGLGYACQFHGHRSDSIRWLAGMHCLVLTSDHEGMPMSAIEALALGVPVVANAVGGLTKLLADQPSCRLVRSQDPAVVAEAILDSTHCLMESAVKPTLSKTYDIDNTAAHYLDIYRRLLHGSHDRRGNSQ